MFTCFYYVVGGEFKRCAIDTLWYVTGKPGHYQIHHRVVEETDEELCLDRLVRPLCSSTTTSVLELVLPVATVMVTLV